MYAFQYTEPMQYEPTTRILIHKISSLFYLESNYKPTNHIVVIFLKY